MRLYLFNSLLVAVSIVLSSCQRRTTASLSEFENSSGDICQDINSAAQSRWSGNERDGSLLDKFSTFQAYHTFFVNEEVKILADLIQRLDALALRNGESDEAPDQICPECSSEQIASKRSGYASKLVRLCGSEQACSYDGLSDDQKSCKAPDIEADVNASAPGVNDPNIKDIIKTLQALAGTVEVCPSQRIQVERLRLTITRVSAVGSC